jgi:cell division protein FtsZ
MNQGVPAGKPQFQAAAPAAHLEEAPSFADQLNLNGSYPVRQFPIEGEQVHDEKPLPRDILLAKARQYRETQQARSGQMSPEQLSMNVAGGPESSLEMARRLANEIVKSPFDTKNLDVPAFLRRRQASQQQPPQHLDEETENPTV